MIKPGIYLTHDGENHLARFAAYKTAFLDGHFPPRLASDLNYTYGVPIFNFFYPLPGYLAVGLSALGLSYETIFKFLLTVAFIFAPLGMFLFLIQFTPLQNSFLGALLYGLAPYQFLNTFVRGDIGESFALALTPYALFFYFWGVNHKKTFVVAIAGVFASLIILAHHGIGLMMTPFIFSLIVFASFRSKKFFWYLGIFTFLWFGISAFFWIPALMEHKYTLATAFIGDMYKQHFLSFPHFIIKTWGFEADVNTLNGQAPQLGLAAFLLLCLSLVLAKKKMKHSLVLVSFFFFLSSVFLVSSASDIVWSHISLLQKYQFPWRFMALATITMPILIAVLFPLKNKYLIGFIVICIIISSFAYNKTREHIHHPDEWYQQFPGTTFYHGETLTKWSAGAASSYPKNHVEIIQGDGQIEEQIIKTQVEKVLIQSSHSTTVRFNTTYYPGWRAFVDGKETPIQFQDPNSRGLITFTVPEGNHQLEIKFTETKLRLLANIFSVCSIIVALVFIFI